MYLGAHESIAGGTHEALRRGAEHADECLQLFTRNQLQWSARPVGKREAVRFGAESERSAIPRERVLVHASYLINVATPEPAKLRRSRSGLLAEVRRCEALGLELLNLHPGAHMGRGVEAGLARAVDSFHHVIERTPESRVRFVLETTAGQGTCLGDRFEQLRAIIDGVGVPERFAVCLDTAHSFAAGYDLSTQRGYRRVMQELDDVIGLTRVIAFHLNDSRVALGTRVDRHEAIGKGHIGTTAFRCLMRDPRHASALGILELPEAAVVTGLELLRGFRRGTRNKATRAGLQGADAGKA